MARLWGALELFKRAEALDAATPNPANGGGSGRSSQRGVISAWQSGSLEKVPWGELFGLGSTLAPVTYSEAMRVGPVKKGRAVLHSLIASRPLRQYSAGATVPDVDQPTWLYRTDTRISPQLRLAKMLDDHIFYDATLLITLRGALPTGVTDPSKAPILDAVHCPRDRWRLDDDGTILVDEVPANDDQVLWLPGPSAGLLTEAADEIREWRRMRENIGNRLNNPTPFFWLEDTENNLNDGEVRDMVSAFNDARKGTEGGTAYVPGGISAKQATTSDDAQLYVEGRNAARLDIANHLNLPASLLEGSLSTASLTYSTSEGKRDEVADYGLGYWTTPLEGGLSLDNVCPRGKRIRIDFADLFAPTNAPTGAPTED